MPTLVLMSASFLAGIAVGSALPEGFPLLFAAVVSVLGLGGAAYVFRGKPRLRSAFILVSCGLLGLGRSVQTERAFAAQQALWPTGQHGAFLVRVASEPELVFDRTAEGHETGRVGEFYLPKVEKIRMDAVLLSLNGDRSPSISVRVNLRRKPDDVEKVLSCGDWVLVKGVLSEPLPAMNPGGFDYAGFLKSKGIPFTLSARSGDWRLFKKGGGSDFVSASLAFRRAIEDKATELWPYPTNALWVGLLLGGNQTLQDDLVQDFAVTGTVHILAVSGANTALMTGLLFLMLRVLGLRRKSAAGWALAGLGVFVFMTGAPPSVCRAGLWGALVLVSLIAERKPRMGTFAVFSAALLAAFNPFTLVDLSFQLSYLAVLGLVVFTPWWLERMGGLWQPAALTLGATLGAQMGVWVLMAAKFNQFATYSIPANLAVAPLVGVATAAGLLAITTAWVWAAAGSVFAAAAEVPLRLLPWTASWIARWPGASLVVATPPDFWMMLFHLLLGLTLWVFWPDETPEKPSLDRVAIGCRRKRAANGLKGAWGLFLVGTLAAWGISTFQTRPFRMTFLSVGHGDAVVAEDPQGRVMVLDGGPGRDGPARWNPVVAFLHHRGYRKVDLVLSSHPDADHVGGLAAVVESFPVGEAYQPLGAQSQSRSYLAFVEALRKRGILLKPLSRGDSLPFGSGETLEVVHPPKGFHPRKKKDNNRSLAILVSVPPGENTKTILLPGDMEKEAWDLWLGSTNRPDRVDVLLAAHHGRLSGQPERVMAALNPLEVVVSDSNPHPEIRPTVEADRKTEIVETAREGAIGVEVDALGRLQVSRFRPSEDKKHGEESFFVAEEGNKDDGGR